MVIGLLTIAAIPTTIGIAEGVSRRDEANKEAQDQAAEQMRKFHLEAYCEFHSTGAARTIHRGRIILKNGRMMIEPRNSQSDATSFEGFYIEYADPDRPKPLPMGMVSMVFEGQPTLNWIYVDRKTREVCYGNRSKSKDHIVGSWSWEAGDEGGAGGVTLNGGEGAVAVETGEGWQVYWEDDEGKIGDKGKRLQISLERKMLEEEKKEKEKEEGKTVTEPGHTQTTNTTTELTKSRFEDKRTKTDGVQQDMIKVTGGQSKKKKQEPKLEVASNTTTRPMKKD